MYQRLRHHGASSSQTCFLHHLFARFEIKKFASAMAIIKMTILKFIVLMIERPAITAPSEPEKFKMICIIPSTPC